ncbi:MAG: hypothetical protein AB1515_04060 [Nitrospirota bacterium]
MIYTYVPRSPLTRSLLALSVGALLLGCSPSSEPRWTGAWQATEPLIVPRTSAGAVVANGYLYAIGGIRGGGVERGFVKSVEFAKIQPDGSVKDWRLTNSLTMPRGFLKAVAANGHLYAMGGETYRDGLVLLNTVERARLLPNGSLGPWEPVAPMTTPRRSPTGIVSHGHIYAIGGYNGLFLRSVERAAIQPDGSLGAWTVLPASLNTDRYIHGAGHVGDQIYIVGGHIEDVGGGKNSAEWSRVQSDGSLTPWQLTETTKTPRFLASTIAAGPFVFTLGGYHDGYLASVERAAVQPDGSLGAWVETTPLSRPKEGAAVAVAELALAVQPSNDTLSPAARNGQSRRIYLIGGSANGQYLQDVEWAVVNERGELGAWTTRSSSFGFFSEPAAPPPQRPSLEEAHSPQPGAGSSP